MTSPSALWLRHSARGGRSGVTILSRPPLHQTRLTLTRGNLLLICSRSRSTASSSLMLEYLRVISNPCNFRLVARPRFFRFFMVVTNPR
jgi:hypothetical protein